MPKTSTEISFGLIDVAAKQSVTATCDDKQDFVKMDDFALDGVYPPQVATLEKDYWRLDGLFDVFPDRPDLISWGLWSKSMCGADGAFANPIVLDLSFTGLHSSIGVSFEFNPYGEDWCNDLNIKWYKDSTLLYNLDFQPDRWNYSAMQTVENFNHIIVTFKSMNHPYRFLKLQNVIYGILKYFRNSEIVEGSVTEEVDITGASLPYNEMDFTVRSETDEFNIFNPQGIYSLLQRKQQLSVLSFIDSIRVFWGIFYVDEIKMNDDRTLKISAFDGVGIMDNTYFNGGIYNNKNALELIDEIMDSAGFAYSIDESLTTKTVTGYIPYGTHRDALQMVAFAIGAFVDTSRTGTIQILVIPDLSVEPDIKLGLDRQIVGGTVNYSELVTGVDVTAYTYSTAPRTSEDGDRIDPSEVYKGALAVGDNRIQFGSPIEVDTLKTSHGTIKEKGNNYCIITSTTEVEEATLTAYQYVQSKKIFSYRAEEVPAGEKENIMSVSRCTTINDNNAMAVAKYIYDVQQYRIEQKFSVVPLEGKERPSVAVAVQNEYNEYRNAVIEQTQTDLYDGLLTQISTKGV